MRKRNSPKRTVVPTTSLATAPELDRLRLQTAYVRRRLGAVDPAVLAALAVLAFETREAAR
jgi:hypothetical protein